MESRFFPINYNGILTDIIPHIKTAPIEEADVVLIWQDVSEKFAPTVEMLKKLGKKVILLTHCYGSCNDYLAPHNHKSLADKILVWGQADYNLAMQAGLGHKTVITGTPIFSHKKTKQKHKDFTVVLAPSHDYKDIKKATLLADELTKGGHLVYTKLIGDNDCGLPNPVFSKQTDEHHIDICFDILSKADIVVVDDPTTTFALFAFACDIPVVYVELNQYNYFFLNNYLRSGIYNSTLSGVNATIQKIKDNDTKKHQRKLWAEYCGAFIKNPTKNILKEIGAI